MFRVTFRVMCFILLLTLSLALLAADMTIQEKELEAKRLSDQFKAQTGFVGRFMYNLDDMTFRGLIGSFPDIRYNRNVSQTEQRALAENVIKKCLQYIRVPDNQLVFHASNKLSDGTGIIDYRQIIDGIGFDNQYGRLSISFSSDEGNEVNLANNLAIVENLKPQMTITKEQAINIMLPLERKNNKDHHDERNARITPPNAQLKYCTFKPNNKLIYRLCWITYWEGYEVDVDAVTGYVWKSRSMIRD